MIEKLKSKIYLIVILFVLFGLGTGYVLCEKDATIKSEKREAYKETYDALQIDIDELTGEYGEDINIQDYVRSSSGELTIEEEIDSGKPGDYIVTFILSDTEEQFHQEVEKKTKRIFTIEDTQYPNIEIGQEEILIRQGTETDLNENVLSATDPVDGDVEFTVESKLDIDTPGEYEAKVVATDKNGNTSEKTFMVNVKAKPSLNAAFDQIYDYITKEMGLNSAAACGILANIRRESSFNPTAGTSYYGLCQWGGGRRSNLQSWCGANGYDYTTIKGQLAFMNHELNTSYTTCLNLLKEVEDTEDGAYEAALIFVRRYEGAASAGDRASLAKTYFNL